VPDKNETPEQEGPTSSAYTIPSTFYLSSGGKSSLFAQKNHTFPGKLLHSAKDDAY
jgi:hypothetical protein